MKNFLLLAVLFFSIQLGYGQEKTIHPNQNSLYSSAGIEVKPDFPGGIKEFHKYIAKNYITPREAKEIKGKIYVTFIVEIDGSLTDIKVLRDLGFGTSEEAIRVLKLSPKWIPGQQKGMQVRSLFTLPISINGF
ncbi:energy transducer TonB [Flavobacterium seoulense]|uniref:Biopolymer transporter TonB n=1 Tax=Flavobacterium seoulense TaxID=1492738 RepID=A0A066WUA4_9FLAO|nr:energy transducer TonB [Flavobacterium seoulense]KDN54250.1 biopolymer transporter TonB [Flavobacterium seoulense]